MKDVMVVMGHTNERYLIIHDEDTRVSYTQQKVWE